MIRKEARPKNIKTIAIRSRKEKRREEKGLNGGWEWSLSFASNFLSSGKFKDRVSRRLVRGGHWWDWRTVMGFWFSILFFSPSFFFFFWRNISSAFDVSYPSFVFRIFAFWSFVFGRIATVGAWQLLKGRPRSRWSLQGWEINDVNRIQDWGAARPRVPPSPRNVIGVLHSHNNGTIASHRRPTPCEELLYHCYADVV